MKCACGKDAIVVLKSLVNLHGADMVTKEMITISPESETPLCHPCFMRMCAGAISSFFGVGKYMSTVGNGK